MGNRARYSDTNLIINYLPQDMKDEELKYIFMSIGAVKRCRIIRDKTTGLSYGYAFCEFEKADDATKAIENLNGLPIKNKKLKVAFARLPGEESKNCNVYVQNLPVWVTKEKLQSYFEQFGPIIQCRVVASGNAKAVGFCLFETRSSAQNAINELDSKPWPGSAQPTLRVRFADDSSKKVGGQLTTTRINELNVPGSQAALIAAMNVTSNPQNSIPQNMTYMPPMPNNQQNSGAGPIRNHAFLRQGDNRFNPMADPGIAPPYVGNPNGAGPNTSLFGKSSGIPGTNYEPVDESTPGVCDHPVANTKGVGVVGSSGSSISERYVIYVYNIGNKMDDDHLFYMFVPFGNVVQANVARDKDTMEPKNYGFVTFSNYQSGVNAINAMNGFVLSDKVLQVSFKK